MSSTFVLPTVHISQVIDSRSLVLLPEIIYKISLPKANGLKIIGSYKPILTKENSIFYKIAKDYGSAELFTKQSLDDSVKLGQYLGKAESPDPDFEVLLISIISRNNVATVCKIIDIVTDPTDSSKLLISFRAVARGEILQKVQESSSFASYKTRVYTNDSRTLSTKDIQSMSISELSEAYINFKSEFKLLFQNVTSFLYYFHENDNSYSQLLKLSPIANLLKVILFKNKALVNVQRLYEKFVARGLTVDSKSNVTIVSAMLKFYDLILCLLPISTKIKSEFLSSLDWKQRLALGNKNLVKMNQVFASYKTNSAFIWSDFIENGQKDDKVKVLISQLEGIRDMVEDISDKNGHLKIGAKNTSFKNSFAPKPFNLKQGGNIRNKPPMNPKTNNDDANAKFVQFYEKLCAEPCELHIHKDSISIIKKAFERFFQMNNPSSADYQVLQNYLDTVIDLPWSISETKSVELTEAKKQLDADHYGLISVKKRLLEYLGVLNLQFKLQKNEGNANNTLTAPILCLSGPPGVGKTSLAQSVATTLGRSFQKVSLGGVNDEAEIRGHRRTYVASMPGKIVNALRRAQSLNPVILLDEIDKLGVGGNRGDPQAALLEVLDPAQNQNFQDHFLDFPIDLSQVLFFCTANDLGTIHPALLDRMEIIQIPGYNYMEKVKIVEQFVLPKQLKKNFLPPDGIKFEKDTTKALVTEFTYPEAGIRNLERQIGKICRGKALEYGEFLKDDGKLDKGYNPNISLRDLPIYLGLPYQHDTSKVFTSLSDKFGTVHGLAYNSNGTGSTLLFETVAVPSNDGGRFEMTGRLGQVLTESGSIAMSFVKTYLTKNGQSSVLETLKTNKIHLHAPEGAVPKDGPSAGVAMTLALLSLLIKKPIPSNIAMTGEMTLRGLILPVGGIKEKLLGAHLSNVIKTVLLPRSNRKDVIEMYVTTLDTNEKNKALFNVLREEKDFDVRIYGEPEKYVYKTLGLKIQYIEEFKDVVDIVWSSHNVGVVARL